MLGTLITDEFDNDGYERYRQQYTGLMTQVSAVLRRSVSFTNRKA